MSDIRLAELVARAKGKEWLPELISSAPWQDKLSPHFLLHYYSDAGGDEAFHDTLLVDMERLYREVSVFIQCGQQTSSGARPSKPKFECFILHTSSTRTHGSVGQDDRMFYLLDPVQDPDYLQRLRHEIVHLVWGWRYGEAPPLFLEGVANYAEHLSVPRAHVSVFLQNARAVLTDTPPLAEIAETEAFWERGSFYAAGGLFVWYLVERWGWERLGHLFEISDYRDTDILNHFYDVYQADLATVDSEWRQHLISLPAQ